MSWQLAQALSCSNTGRSQTLWSTNYPSKKVTVKNGKIQIPDEPGLGIEIGESCSKVQTGLRIEVVRVEAI